MWNLKFSNRVLDQKTKQLAHKKHIRALRNVKSSLNNSTPKQYSFLYSRPKARQLQYQKQRSIETNNTILIQKMLSTQSCVKPREGVFLKDSLINVYNRKKQRQIDLDNQGLVKRLQNVYSQYGQGCTQKSAKRHFQLRSHMANSRMDPSYQFEVNKKSEYGLKSRPFSAKR